MQEGIWTTVVRCGPVAQCNPIHHRSGTKVVAVISIESVDHPLCNPDPVVRFCFVKGIYICILYLTYYFIVYNLMMAT
jgi:hypothetical protein